MAFLRQSIDKKERVAGLLEAVDDGGQVLAKGRLELELVLGASRHGSVAFVTAEGAGPPAAGHRAALAGDALLG